MVNSETPACRNAPVKSSLVNACVFFKKPSVLSEFDRSAEETIMFSTSVASTPRTLAEALRVASPAFCSIAFQFTFGALPENHSSNLAASSGLALVHSALAAYFSATIFSVLLHVWHTTLLLQGRFGKDWLDRHLSF